MANEAFVASAWAKLEQAGMTAMRRFAEKRIEAIRENIGVPVEYRGRTVIRSVKGEYPRRESGALWRSVKATDPVSMDRIIDIFIYTDVIHAAFLEFKDPNHGGRPWWGRSYQDILDNFDEFKALFAESLSQPVFV